MNPAGKSNKDYSEEDYGVCKIVARTPLYSLRSFAEGVWILCHWYVLSAWLAYGEIESQWLPFPKIELLPSRDVSIVQADKLQCSDEVAAVLGSLLKAANVQYMFVRTL